MKKTITVGLAAAAVAAGLAACRTAGPGGAATVNLITLDPGHFHAALVQKSMYMQVDPVVHVYAPAGADLEGHLARIESYNTRTNEPTAWKEVVYRGPDYFERMLREKPGNVMVVSGNNRRKIEYIKGAVDAGLNVLADKPMVIDPQSFPLLCEAFAAAQKKGVLLYDIMTERNEITTLLQRELSMIPAVFGKLEAGTPDQPSVTKVSVHHFSKVVSGKPLVRPAWFFDVTQQGEGIVDVTTHLVDLIQWECFPEQAIDYTKDVRMLTARRWTTRIGPAEFEKVTGLKEYPDYLKKDVKDGNLEVFANGEMTYALRGVHAKVSVTWNFEAPAGAGDTHFSVMRGTQAILAIRQGPEQQYKPTLYVEPAKPADAAAIDKALPAALAKIGTAWPGVAAKKNAAGWEIIIPDAFKVGHEAHFAQVATKYLKYLGEGRLPAWEVPNMIAKYYTTTRAMELAKQAK